jgi:predicted transcriptional regulator of viral defense system
MRKTKMDQILELARERGIIRPRDLTMLGIDPNHLRSLVQSGAIKKTGRGLYSLTDFDVTESHSLVAAARAQSKGVICLLSALSFHGVGTQLPYQVWVAVPHGARITKTDGVPMRVVVVGPSAYEAGIEMHRIEGVEVPIYSVAKTVADCFKFRSTVGLDVALESLSAALRDRRSTRDEIRKHAVIDRVENVMRPYVEALSV